MSLSRVPSRIWRPGTRSWLDRSSCLGQRSFRLALPYEVPSGTEYHCADVCVLHSVPQDWSPDIFEALAVPWQYAEVVSIRPRHSDRDPESVPSHHAVPVRHLDHSDE